MFDSIDWKKLVVLLLQALIAAMSGGLAGNYCGHVAAVNAVAPK